MKLHFIPLVVLFTLVGFVVGESVEFVDKGSNILGDSSDESLVSSFDVDDDNYDIDPILSRKVRQAPPTPPPSDDLNLADDVSEDYPVVFSIILFLSIILILALIAISVSLASMDPGRDSLIYRVTTQRLKKDN